MTMINLISDEDMHPEVANDMEIMRQLFHLCINYCDTQNEVEEAMVAAMRIVKNGHNRLSFTWPSLLARVLHEELYLEGN